MLSSTRQTGKRGPMEMLPSIPPVAPSRDGLASGDRYPFGETMKPVTVDAAVRKRTQKIRAELLVTNMILSWQSRGAATVKSTG